MTAILIVDDNPQNLYMLETILKGHGYLPVLAKNGAEALDLGIKNPPDLIIADILMPVMDGFKLCQLWKSNEQLKDIPFIFYTATYTDQKDEQFALSLGAQRYVVKPQKPDVLIKIVEEVLEEARHNGNFIPKNILVTDLKILEEYNEVLFHKLEKKVMQLELDISEREAAELALRESEERFRKIFESGAIGIALLDPDLWFIRVNEEFCKMLGYSEQEMLKKKGMDVTRPDHRKIDEENIQKLIDGGIPVYSTEKPYVKKDGSIIWSMTRITSFCDKDGKLIYFIVFASDITEQIISHERERKALQQIQKNLIQLATLNDQIRNPLSIIIARLMLEEKTKSSSQIIEAVKSIDDIVKRLDEGWAESSKVREFLEKYKQISEEN